MTEKDICLDFIKHFYYVTASKAYNDNTIIFHDCCEVPKTNKLNYVGTVFGYDVFLVWDKAEKITTINIQKKDNDCIKHFTKMIKHSQTFSFIKYLVESLNKYDRTIQMSLNDVKEEFPLLYGEVENSDLPIFHEFT